MNNKTIKKKRTVHTVYDEDGTTLTNSRDILRAFQKHYSAKYAPIPIDVNSIHNVVVHTEERIPEVANRAFESCM
jgi:hypothetical protein